MFSMLLLFLLLLGDPAALITGQRAEGYLACLSCTGMISYGSINFSQHIITLISTHRDAYGLYALCYGFVVPVKLLYLH